MLKNNAKTIHLIYGILVAILVIALGITLILSCLDIYQADPTGDPYSPATIRAHFHDIAIQVYATLAAILGGILIHFFLPVKAEKPKPIRDQLALMKKAAAKAEPPSGTELALICRENKLRRAIVIGCTLLFAALMVYPAIHVFRFHNYAAPNPTAEVMKTSLIIFAPAVLGFVICHIGAGLISKSYHRQTEIYKKLPKRNEIVTDERKVLSKKATLILRCAILAVAVVFIIMGIFNKTAADVLAKAAAICTECIGLG